MLRRVLLRPLFWVAVLYVLFFLFTSRTNGQEILPLSQVKVGERGYGLTVFRGIEPERFEFEILSLPLEAEPLGLDKKTVWIELYGGPKYKDGREMLKETNVFSGMSGSPLFIRDKIFAVIVDADPFSKKPQAGALPVEAVLNAKPSGLEKFDSFFKKPDTNFVLKAGEAYRYCEVWGDDESCGAATVSIVDPKDASILHFQGHAGDDRTGVMVMPFWRAEVDNVKPNLKGSSRDSHMVGTMLGSIVFNGPFGQTGKLNVIPESVALTVTLKNNFLNGDRVSRYFLAYTHNLGKHLAKILANKSKFLVDNSMDVDIAAKIKTRNSGTIILRGATAMANDLAQLANLSVGCPFDLTISDIEVDLTPRPKYKVLSLRGINPESLTYENRRDFYLHVTARGEQEWSKNIKFDQRHFNLPLSIATGEEVAEQIISKAAKLDSDTVDLLNQVSERNALYIFRSPDSILISDSGHDRTSGKKGTKPEPKWRGEKVFEAWEAETRAFQVEILKKIDLPGKEYLINGKSDFVFSSETKKRKRHFLIF